MDVVQTKKMSAMIDVRSHLGNCRWFERRVSGYSHLPRKKVSNNGLGYDI